MVRFGTAGNPREFYEQGNISSERMPVWLNQKGLSAYEYQCSRGIMIGEDTAKKIGEQALKYNIKLSVHAPYYISLATLDEQTGQNTERHILNSVKVAQWLNAYAVIFHIGGIGKTPRQEAFTVAKKRFENIVKQINLMNLNGVKLAPETYGKLGQLGNVQEIIELCKIANFIIPAVDFGHLNAIGQGSFISQKEYKKVFDHIEQELGREISSKIHIHFSKIEFTKAGEKKHWTFSNNFGPPYEPLLEIIAIEKYQPVIICESMDTQAKDALTMKEYFENFKNNMKSICK